MNLAENNRQPKIISSNQMQKWLPLLFALISVLILSGQLIYSINRSGIGFPLDDAWIHQTYARTFINTGSWGYSLNGVSAGSTSPMWTFLLTPGFLFGDGNPYFWTFMISGISLAALVYVLIRLIQKQPGISFLNQIVFGIMVITEWHLIWAAGSGMETVFYVLGIATVFFLLMQERAQYLLIGLISGFLIWVRPDGLTIIGPVLFVIVYRIVIKKLTVKEMLKVLIGFFIPLAGYLIFNYSVNGSIFPNTFLSKTTEYNEITKISWLTRLVRIFSIPISGVGALLLPGFIWQFYKAIKEKNIWMISMFFWIVGLGIIYSSALPAVYQHGRYLIPVIPFFIFLGWLGSINLINKINPVKRKGYDFVVSAGLCVTGIIFLISSIFVYSQDVLVINKLMVEPALWVKENTPEGSLIAAHDIGAIGYFSERKIIDLAGLISPEVIPFMRDETKLKRFIAEKGANYLVVLSNWYVSLVDERNVVKSFEINIHQMNQQPGDKVEIARLLP